jgi:hypothetical protein
MTVELIVIESATKKDSSITATSSRMDRLGEAGKVFGLHGFVSYPAKGSKGIRIRLGRFSFVVSITRDDIAPPDNPGEAKVYSTDADGTQKATHLLDKDGVHIFNEGATEAARKGDSVMLTMNETDVVALATALLATGAFTPSGSPPAPSTKVVFTDGEITSGTEEVLLP